MLLHQLKCPWGKDWYLNLKILNIIYIIIYKFKIYRQLMSGVDNLRVLASALENVDRIEDRTKDFLPDFDEDNAAGPAL